MVDSGDEKTKHQWTNQNRITKRFIITFLRATTVIVHAAHNLLSIVLMPLSTSSVRQNPWVLGTMKGSNVEIEGVERLQSQSIPRFPQSWAVLTLLKSCTGPKLRNKSGFGSPQAQERVATSTSSFNTVDACEILHQLIRGLSNFFSWRFNHPFGGAGIRNHPQYDQFTAAWRHLPKNSPAHGWWQGSVNPHNKVH